MRKPRWHRHMYRLVYIADESVRVECVGCGDEALLDIEWLEAILPAAMEEARLFGEEGFVVLSGRMTWEA